MIRDSIQPKDNILPNAPIENVSTSPSIDFCFIGQLDGFDYTQAYIPETGIVGANGVHVASHFDLSNKTDHDLRKLFLNPTLIGKLYPYLGRKGEDAAQYFAKQPLLLSNSECNAIALGMHKKIIFKLIMRYDAASYAAFCELPECWQTVMASFELRGECIHTTMPTLWGNIVLQNFELALAALIQEDELTEKYAQELTYIRLNSPTTTLPSRLLK